MYETYLFDLNFFIIRLIVCVCVSFVVLNYDGRMCHHWRKVEYYTHMCEVDTLFMKSAFVSLLLLLLVCYAIQCLFKDIINERYIRICISKSDLYKRNMNWLKRWKFIGEMNEKYWLWSFNKKYLASPLDQVTT